ncbi:MAG: CHRD domain-containing protein [Rhodospirillales bacterium]|nr:CHRD domain-containing protein [Rhodospirillales bacterium]
MRPTLIAAGLLAGLTAASFVPAHAATLHFMAKMDGAQEVPPKTGNGTGMAMATLDTATGMLNYTVTFSGLSGPATMAHFHGPAAAGKNAGVLVPLGKAPTSPIKGMAKLTPAEIKDFETGMVYVNVHTKANPGGEIRGQMEETK